MKAMGIYLANLLGGIQWYPPESRAQDGWGPEGEAQRAFPGSALEAVGLKFQSCGKFPASSLPPGCHACLIGYIDFINK